MTRDLCFQGAIVMDANPEQNAFAQLFLVLKPEFGNRKCGKFLCNAETPEFRMTYGQQDRSLMAPPGQSSSHKAQQTVLYSHSQLPIQQTLQGSQKMPPPREMQPPEPPLAIALFIRQDRFKLVRLSMAVSDVPWSSLKLNADRMMIPTANKMVNNFLPFIFESSFCLFND